KDGPSRGPGAVALLAGQLHPLAHRLGAPLAGNAARILFDVLVTSVPLPRATLSFGGCPLREIYPMAPLARGQSLAVGLTTYGGQVHVGLVADGKALPDLDGLAKNMTAELNALLRTTSGEPSAGVERAPAVEPVAPAGVPAEPASASAGAVSAAPTARGTRRAGPGPRGSAGTATPATPAAPAEAAPPAPVQLALIAEPAEPVDLAR
ncbi:WS/DGAT domain-containing protein, partial [Streptomyces niveus]